MPNKITPFFWFEKDMDAVLEFYQNIFSDFKIGTRNTLSETPSGKVEIVNLEMNGFSATFMTAGPLFKFTEAISFVISCDGQEEVDYFWNKLTKEGVESMCGWCKDKYGLSWQVVPKQLHQALGNPDREKAKFAQNAMMKMKKIIISDLK